MNPHFGQTSALKLLLRRLGDGKEAAGLSPDDRQVLVTALQHVVTDVDTYQEYLTWLVKEGNVKISERDREELIARADQLLDANWSKVSEQGLNAFDDQALVGVASNPAALAGLFYQIDEELPPFWLEVMERALPAATQETVLEPVPAPSLASSSTAQASMFQHLGWAGLANLAAAAVLWFFSVAMANRTLANLDWWIAVQQSLFQMSAGLALVLGVVFAWLRWRGSLSNYQLVPVAVCFVLVVTSSWGVAQVNQSLIRSDLHAVFREHRWIAYDPPGYNPYPETARMPSEQEMLRDLKLLRDAKTGGNFDGLITFNAYGTLAQLPRLAKSKAGFERVIMGIAVGKDKDGNVVKPVDQMRAAVEAAPWVDGYCLGHNTPTSLDLDELARWMHELRQATGKPVTTTAPLVSYLGERGQKLRAIGDWFFPDVVGSWMSGATPRQVYEETRQALREVTDMPRDRPVLLKMVSCPSGGSPAFTEESQALFFTWLTRDFYLPSGVYMSFYAGMDIPWMSRPSEWSPQQPHVGLFTADGRPKPAVAVVRQQFPIQSRP